MITIPPDFQTALRGSANLSLACRIVTSAGVVLGFSNHTRTVTLPELTVGTVTVPETEYKSSECRFPVNISRSSDVRKVDNWEFVILTGGQVSKTDTQKQLLRGATYFLLFYNRDDLTHQGILMRGTVGEATVNGLECHLKMRGLGHALQQEILHPTSPTSQAQWGDPELAFFDLTGNTHDSHAARTTTTVTSVGADARRELTLSAISGFPARRFVGGTVRFTSGANDGVTVGIQQCVAGVIVLDPPGVPLDIVSGVGVVVQIGVPRTLGDWITCFGTGERAPFEPLITTIEKAAEVIQ